MHQEKAVRSQAHQMASALKAAPLCTASDPPDPGWHILLCSIRCAQTLTQCTQSKTRSANSRRSCGVLPLRSYRSSNGAWRSYCESPDGVPSPQAALLRYTT